MKKTLSGHSGKGLKTSLVQRDLVAAAKTATVAAAITTATTAETAATAACAAAETAATSTCAAAETAAITACATAEAAATTTEATFAGLTGTEGAFAFGLGLGLVATDGTTVEGRAVQSCESLGSVFGSCKGNEAESTAATSVTIHHDDGVSHFAIFLKRSTQTLTCGIPGEPSDKQLHL